MYLLLLNVHGVLPEENDFFFLMLIACLDSSSSQSEVPGPKSIWELRKILGPSPRSSELGMLGVEPQSVYPGDAGVDKSENLKGSVTMNSNPL